MNVIVIHKQHDLLCRLLYRTALRAVTGSQPRSHACVEDIAKGREKVKVRAAWQCADSIAVLATAQWPGHD